MKTINIKKEIEDLEKQFKAKKTLNIALKQMNILLEQLKEINEQLGRIKNKKAINYVENYIIVEIKKIKRVLEDALRKDKIRRGLK